MYKYLSAAYIVNIELSKLAAVSKYHKVNLKPKTPRMRGRIYNTLKEALKWNIINGIKVPLTDSAKSLDIVADEKLRIMENTKEFIKKVNLSEIALFQLGHPIF